MIGPAIMFICVGVVWFELRWVFWLKEGGVCRLLMTAAVSTAHRLLLLPGAKLFASPANWMISQLGVALLLTAGNYATQQKFLLVCLVRTNVYERHFVTWLVIWLVNWR